MISVLRNINKPVDPEFRFTIEIVEDPSVADPNYFIDNPGESIEDYTHFILPLGSARAYDFTIDWGDGSGTDYITSYIDAAIDHDYTTPGPGIYLITINGASCEGFVFNGGVHAKQMREVQNWGIYTVGTTASNAFYGCTGMTVIANDTWDTTGVGDFTNAFRECRTMSHFPGIENWDMSSATTFDNMFYNCRLFNSNISNWKPDLVNDMSGMFYNCFEFDQPVGNWDMTNCTMVNGMFQGCRKFNRPLTNWNARSNFFENLNYTFYDCREFDQDLSGWMTASPVCDSLIGTFRECWVFDNLGQSLNVWDTSNVLNMGYCFSGAKVFNRPLSNWDTALVVNMSNMFSLTKQFDQPLLKSGSNWDTSSVTTMDSMFNNALVFNGNITNWETTSLNNMSLMFNGALRFNQPLVTSGNIWDVSLVTTFYRTFESAALFDQSVNSWITTSANNMARMFNNCGSALVPSGYNHPVGNFNMTSVTSIDSMFLGCDSFDQVVSTWTITSLLTDASNAFRGTSFNGNISTWDVTGLVYAAQMFKDCPLQADTNGFSSWVPSSLVNAYRMFMNCVDFNGNVSGWNVSSLSNIEFMFYACNSFDRDLSSWTTAQLTTTYGAFYATQINCSLDNFDTSIVTNFASTFTNCSLFNTTLNWDTSSGENFSSMFRNCPSLKKDLTWIDVSSATNMSNFLLGSDINNVGTTTNYDALLASMVADNPITGVKFHGGNSDYSATGKISRDILENTDPPPKGYSWIITDGDLV